METVRIENGETEKIVAYFIDSTGTGITGETVPLSVWRESDGWWFTGSGWQATYTSVNMTEKAQGYYFYNFDTTGLADDTYHIKALCGAGSCINPSQVGELKAGFFIDDIGGIKTQTDKMDFDGSNYLSSRIKATDDIGLSTTQKADVNAEADTALADYDPPTRAELTSDTASIISEVNENEAKIDALPTAAGIADAILDEDMTGHDIAGTAGEALGDAAAGSSLTAADIWTYGTRSLTTFGTLVSDIWNYSTRALTEYGTLIADIWTYTNRTLTSYGTLVADIWASATRTLTAGTRDAEIDAIKAATDNLPADPAQESTIQAAIAGSDAKIDTIDGIVDALAVQMARLLGLGHENIYIDTTVFDSDSNLTSARVRIYSDKASVGTTSDVIATYTITAVATGPGTFSSWKQVRQ